MAAPDVDLLLAHDGFLRGIARGLVADEALAEDVVQETYLAALSDTRRRDVRAWLGGVARNLARMALRSEARRRRREQRPAPTDAAASVPDAIAKLELQREVVGAVLALDEPYRSTVLFRHFYELPLDEIARRMRAPVETVRTRLRRALERLREVLDEAHGGERRAWFAPLLVISAAGTPTTAAALAGGVVAMSKTKLALVGALVLILGLLVFQLGGRGGLAPARSEPAHPQAREGASAEGTATGAPAPVSSSATAEAPAITVVEEGGAPLKGVAVLAITEADLKGPAGERSWYWPEPDSARAVATSDAEGRVRVPEPSPILLFLKAGYEPQAAASAEAVVTLFRGRTLEGHVADTEGRPIAGARVHVLCEGRGAPPLPRRETITDALGEYRFRHLPARTYALRARAPGYREKRMDEMEAGERLDLTLTRATLLVDVTDRESGALIEGAGGLVLRPDGAFVAGLVVGEPAGRLLLDESVGSWHGDAGALDLHVLAPGHRTLVQRIELRKDREPPHVLAALVRGEEGPVLAGRVLAAAPARVEVRARSPEGFGEMTDNQLPVLAAAPCAADGAFALGGLPPGRYRLVARAESVGEKGIDVTAPAQGIEIELKPAATLVVQAVSLDGEPVPDAWIHVESVGGRFWCLKAGAGGRARFEDLPEDRFLVLPKPRETQEKVRSTLASVEEIHLRAGEAASVTVRVPSPVPFTYVVVDEAGAPWAGATITLLPNYDDYAQILEEDRFYGLKLATGDGGRVAATLFPGMYEVKVRAGARNCRAWLAVPMERDATVRITLPRRGKTLRGRVVDAGTGEAIPGRPIYVEDRGLPDARWFAEGVTGEDGSFEMEGMPDAPVRVRVAPNLRPDRNPYPDNAYTSGYLDIDLRADGGPFDITLAREAAGKTVECQVRVTDAKTGAPLENAGASAHGLVGTTWVLAGWARTDANGRAVAPLVAAKRYRVVVTGPFGTDPPYVRQEREIGGAEGGTLVLDVSLERGK